MALCHVPTRNPASATSDRRTALSIGHPTRLRRLHRLRVGAHDHPHDPRPVLPHRDLNRRIDLAPRQQERTPHQREQEPTRTQGEQPTGPPRHQDQERREEGRSPARRPAAPSHGSIQETRRDAAEHADSEGSRGAAQPWERRSRCPGGPPSRPVGRDPGRRPDRASAAKRGSRGSAEVGPCADRRGVELRSGQRTKRRGLCALGPRTGSSELDRRRLDPLDQPGR